MKKVLFGLGLLSFLAFSSCDKDTGTDPVEKEVGTLKLVVSYYTGEKAPNADASIYTTQEDYNNKTNAVATSKTDQGGEVYFEDIEVLEYWWYVKGTNGADNASSTHWSGGALAKDKVTEKLVQIR